MAKLRVTLDVDSIALFDMLATMKGECGPLGERIAGLLMTGERGLSDSLGLAIYGIVCKSVEQIGEQDQPQAIDPQ